jgi:DNA-binding transcriptional regulator YiaG
MAPPRGHHGRMDEKTLRLLVEARVAAHTGVGAKIRVPARLSQGELARAAGVNPAMLSRWESGGAAADRPGRDPLRTRAPRPRHQRCPQGRARTRARVKCERRPDQRAPPRNPTRKQNR